MLVRTALKTRNRYRSTTFGLSEMANQMATLIFIFGNLILLRGLLKLYLSDI